MRHAFRAKNIIPLAEDFPARGLKALDAPLAELDDAVLLVRDGLIEAVETYRAFRRGRTSCPLTDLGAVRIVPAFINAHCHLELSHLAGKIPRGLGFAGWMRALLPLLGPPADPAEPKRALAAAFQALLRGGTAHVGDVGSLIPALVAEAASAAVRSPLPSDNGPPRSAEDDADRFGVAHGILRPEGALVGPALSGLPYPVTHFLETLGFAPHTPNTPHTIIAAGRIPSPAAALPPERLGDCAVSGHALYSTDPEALRAAARWCQEHERTFSIHLAESLEEEECLVFGRGALHDLLRVRMLPPDWSAPGLRPVLWASRLDLLGPRTLAVHAVHCDAADIALLGASGASVCLCPRSNAFIKVGTAPAKALAEAGVPLCLGTDSLASNEDLDMRREMRFAAGEYALSFQALLRMATGNGAHALGLEHLGSLAPGKAACFAVLGGTGGNRLWSKYA
jgi:cytosine/adenosine deaminase-related metal-dependent hydrolase